MDKVLGLYADIHDTLLASNAAVIRRALDLYLLHGEG